MRTWRILLQIIKHEFITFQSVPYIAHVEMEVLYDEIEHLAPHLLVQINEIRSRVLLQIQKQVGISKD